jgi:hypothetical protein
VPGPSGQIAEVRTVGSRYWRVIFANALGTNARICTGSLDRIRGRHEGERGAKAGNNRSEVVRSMEPSRRDGDSITAVHIRRSACTEVAISPVIPKLVGHDSRGMGHVQGCRRKGGRVGVMRAGFIT